VIAAIQALVPLVIGLRLEDITADRRLPPRWRQ
jgi:hypothetical protein